MIDYYPPVLMLVTMFVWVFTARRGNRLMEAFWERLPQVAQREVSGVIGRSIENCIFPLRRRAVEVLRGDQTLWRLRQTFLFWAALSLLVPVLGLLPLAVLALTGAHR